MKNKKKELPAPYAEQTKDHRYADTFEVMVPVPDRVRPHRVAMQFESKERAEQWIHSAEGREAIGKILKSGAR